MADFVIDDTVSIKEEGHKILKLIDNEDGTYNLIVEKVGD